MIYSLEFHEKALKEFKDLNKEVRERFKWKLAERLENPHVDSDRLRGTKNRYKIKFKTPGVRLVYEVLDDIVVVCVIAVAARERGLVYEKALRRVYVRRK